MAFILNRRGRDSRENQLPSPPRNVQQLRAAADLARDNRKWPEAARLYLQYLTHCADDAPIWVQLGHALKESGDLGEAEAAYKKSVALAPDVADTRLQLGHLYKKMRNFSDAIAAYREAARIDDMLADARIELAGFGVGAEDLPPTQRSASPRRPTTFIDLSDVFFYPDDRRIASAVQQFQLGVAAAIIAMPPEERAGSQFVSEAYDSPQYVVIDDALVGELADEMSRGKIEPTRLISIARSATSRGYRYEPSAGDVLLILGEFWVSENITERIIDLGRKGVRIGALIHDVMPITRPEFCTVELAESFKSALLSMLRVADFILCVSDHAARAIEDFAAENRMSPPAIRTLKPAYKFGNEPAGDGDLSIAIARLIREEYVLYVSTVEARKNHGYLLRVWKRLLDRHGSRTPKLVLVGEPGWRGDELLRQLQSTNNLHGNVVMLSDVSGAELGALYQSARFTVFPSVEEGWAAPVAASLACGRPCVASSTGSVPELAGDLVDYFDPFNDNDGYEKIARLIEDNEYLDERARNIAEKFRPREWRDVAIDAVAIVRALRDDWGPAEKSVEPPPAAPGRVYRLGHREDVAEFIRNGDSTFVQFACDTSWDAVESFGRWMRGRTGRITFATERREAGPILVMVEMFTVAWAEPMQLRIAINGTNYPPVELEAGARRFLLLHATADNGRVALELGAVGEIAAGLDPREYLWLGVASIGYAPSADALARVMLLEDIMSGMSNLITIRPTRASYRSDPSAWPRHDSNAEEPDDSVEEPDDGVEEPAET
ncbi:MAG TPA: glycosyltransferase [Stellaceae bacterium]|jgi:glycosyltransferase involved in cell wall biosynthesis